jgi:sugar-specific transcriptional regulator TrmB
MAPTRPDRYKPSVPRIPSGRVTKPSEKFRENQATESVLENQETDSVPKARRAGQKARRAGQKARRTVQKARRTISSESDDSVIADALAIAYEKDNEDLNQVVGESNMIFLIRLATDAKAEEITEQSLEEMTEFPDADEL